MADRAREIARKRWDHVQARKTARLIMASPKARIGAQELNLGGAYIERDDEVTRLRRLLITLVNDCAENFYESEALEAALLEFDPERAEASDE